MSTTTTNQSAALLFDKRVVERNIRNGHVTQSSFDAHLKSLPDVEEHSVTMTAQLDGQESVDDSDE
ncbi:MAG: hypothetical protein Q8Q09_20100 [Deltaproteobacteria bacterium]|nr:hypothetical protein [Deltaproteobacteria bacterium]